MKLLRNLEEKLIILILKITAFCDVTPCSLVYLYRRFIGTMFLRIKMIICTL
jgi:hypothetical protein